jgi:hypothetical protein
MIDLVDDAVGDYYCETIDVSNCERIHVDSNGQHILISGFQTKLTEPETDE